MKKTKKRNAAFLITICCALFLGQILVLVGVYIAYFLPYNNVSLKANILEYYEKNDNYIELKGTIKATIYFTTFDELSIDIELETPNEFFPSNSENGLITFNLVNWSTHSLSLVAGDFLNFTSAPKYFSIGHILPIVRIEKNGEELLSFDKGKANYIDWIEKSFSPL